MPYSSAMSPGRSADRERKVVSLAGRVSAVRSTVDDPELVHERVYPLRDEPGTAHEKLHASSSATPAYRR